MSEQMTTQSSLFYNGTFYDRIFQASPRYAEQNQDVSFWLAMAERYGSSILELACGTGRVSTPLAEAGFEVTGIDISESMLMAARQKSRQVRWLQADVRNFCLQQHFSLIIFPYDTFTHLRELADIKACLHCVKQHLNPGGYFILDFKNPYYVIDSLKTPKPRDIYSNFQDPQTQKTVTVTRECEYDAVEQLYHILLQFTWENSSEVLREVLTLRIFFPKEIEAILLENEFTVVHKFGNYQQDKFSLNTSHHILLCRPTEEL